MKIIRVKALWLLLGILSLGLTGCSEVKYTDVTIQKDDVVVLDYAGLTQEFNDKFMSYDPVYYDANATYVVFRLSVDTQMRIVFDLQLDCGAKKYIKYYGYQYIENNSSLEYGALAAFTKQSLLDHNCLQEGGQLQNIKAEVEQYVEYTTDKVTHTEHYISSNTIEYTAQEINEAFAVFAAP